MKAAAAPSTVDTVVSADGTRITVETMGSGPNLVIVDGALCSRGFGPARALATELASSFTVSFYDRRGRGSSGDTAPYAVARELEDLAAVLAAAGGHPFVYGSSSGAALALEAAAAGLPLRRLASYEAPYLGSGSASGSDGAGAGDSRVDHEARLLSLLGQGKRGGMVSYFLVMMVGAPAFAPVMMRVIPGVWRQVTAVAHTLPYDAAVLDGFTVPTDRFAAITVPTRVMVGGKAAANMADAQARVAQAIPGSQRVTLAGQTHQVSAAAIAPQLREFFA